MKQREVQHTQFRWYTPKDGPPILQQLYSIIHYDDRDIPVKCPIEWRNVPTVKAPDANPR